MSHKHGRHANSFHFSSVLLSPQALCYGLRVKPFVFKLFTSHRTKTANTVHCHLHPLGAHSHHCQSKHFCCRDDNRNVPIPGQNRQAWPCGKACRASARMQTKPSVTVLPLGMLALNERRLACFCNAKQLQVLNRVWNKRTFQV
jgi:hypothetical protein